MNSRQRKRRRRWQRLFLWTIYDHPRDLPEYWVVRVIEIWPGGGQFMRQRRAGFRELKDARAWIRQCRPGATRLQAPGVDPDPVVFEVWG